MILAVVVALLASFAFAPARPAAAQVNVPITGTATNALGQVVNFAGQFDVQRFAVQGGQLVAIGQLTGTLTNTVTGVVQQVSQLITLPVTGVAQATCEILDLELGPLDLDLLGLVVHLDRVNLEITAVPGAGNLLRRLTCPSQALRLTHSAKSSTLPDNSTSSGLLYRAASSSPSVNSPAP
jgi:hypothetical protein